MTINLLIATVSSIGSLLMVFGFWEFFGFGFSQVQFSQIFQPLVVVGLGALLLCLSAVLQLLCAIDVTLHEKQK